MMKEMLMVAALSTAAVSAYAVDASQVQKSIALKDGSTVYIFKDGKMAMEDKYGRATRMKQETVMETKDGRKVIRVHLTVSSHYDCDIDAVIAGPLVAGGDCAAHPLIHLMLQQDDTARSEFRVLTNHLSGLVFAAVIDDHDRVHDRGHGVYYARNLRLFVIGGHNNCDAISLVHGLLK